MAFFDKVNAAVSKAGESISNATSKAQQSLSNATAKAQQSIKTMQTINDLKGQISQQEEAIRNTQLAIGQAYAERYSAAPDAEFAQQVAIITAAKAAIANMQQQINELKGGVSCPNCGTLIPAEAAFCPNCGAKVEQAQ